MTAAWTFFDECKGYLADGTIDLNSHTFKAMLSNVAPTPGTNTVKADITEIANGNGYTAGGQALANVTWAETAGGSAIWMFDADDFSWTASGGSIGTFRYIVVYDDTPSSPADPLVGYWDYGSALTITDGNLFVLAVNASGIFRLS